MQCSLNFLSLDFCPVSSEQFWSLLDEYRHILKGKKKEYLAKFGKLIDRFSNDRRRKVVDNARSHHKEKECRRVSSEYVEKAKHLYSTVGGLYNQDGTKSLLPLVNGERIGAFVYEGGDILYFVGFGEYREVIHTLKKPLRDNPVFSPSLNNQLSYYDNEISVFTHVAKKKRLTGFAIIDNDNVISEFESMFSPEITATDLISSWKERGKTVQNVSVEWARERFRTRYSNKNDEILISDYSKYDLAKNNWKWPEKND